MLMSTRRSGVKSFFEEKTDELKAFFDKRGFTFDKLTTECAKEIIETLRRQRSRNTFNRLEPFTSVMSHTIVYTKFQKFDDKLLT